MSVEQGGRGCEKASIQGDTRLDARSMWKGDVRSRYKRGGGLAQGLGIRLFAFGGDHWPLATAHSDPLWVRTCFGCVRGGGVGTRPWWLGVRGGGVWMTPPTRLRTHPENPLI